MTFSHYQHSRVQHQISPTHIQTVIVTTPEYLHGLFRLTVLIPAPRLSWTDHSPRPACPPICPLHECRNDVLYILLQTRRLCNAHCSPLIYCRNIMTFALTLTTITIIVQSLFHPYSIFVFSCFRHPLRSTLCPSPVYPLVLCRKAFYLITARLYLCTTNK